MIREDLPKNMETNDRLNPIIEPPTPEDAEAIVMLKRASWIKTYPNEELGITEEDIKLRIDGEDGQKLADSIEQWKKWIEKGNSDTWAMFIARIGDKVVGLVTPCPINGQLRLGALYVEPELEGKGIGSQLIQTALDWCGPDRDMYLHVASYNQNAIDFYEGFGFKKTDTVVEDDVGTSMATPIPEIEMVRLATNS